MPTTSLGIFYPCLDEAVDPGDFRNNATTTEAALATVFAQSTPLLDRDYVEAQGINPNTTVNTTTTISWNTPPAQFNPNGMFSSGSPTVFTLQSSGSFLVSLDTDFGTSPTTRTSMRAAVLLSGVEQLWSKRPLLNGTITSGHIVSASAGQQISVTWLWTGTGGPITPLFNIQICKISDI